MDLTKRAQTGTLIRTNGNKVYYNVNISPDGEHALSGEPILAEYTDVRTTPIFYETPHHFTLSVVRFSIPTSEIPLQIFPVDLNAPNFDINRGLPSVTLEWNNIPRQEFTTWITQRPNSPIPPNVPLASDVRYGEYYGCYSMQHLLRIYNEALESAFLASQLDGAPITAPPFFAFDTTTKLVSLYVPDNYEAAGVDVFVNNQLGRNFGQSFLQASLGQDQLDGKDIKMVYDFDGFNKLPIVRDGYAQEDYLYMTQEYNTQANISSFTGLVLTTQSIPVRTEWVSGAQADYAGQINPAVNNNNTFFSILTDFELSQTDGYKLGGVVNYTPTAEYRRLSLTSSTPIFKLDLKVFWKDKYSNLRPLFLAPQSPLTVKLLFEKK